MKIISPFPKDEFALEMRNHFLETTAQALKSLQQDDSFYQRFPDLAKEWIPEATSNEMHFFADVLQAVAVKCQTSQVSIEVVPTCSSLLQYLNHLKENADTPELAESFLTSAAKTEGEPVRTFLQCRHGQHRFLLPVENVVEISRQRKINPLPFSDDRVKGLIGFRGEGTPVLDLTRAGFENSTEAAYFVICEHAKNYFAIEVNATDDVLKLKSSDFQTSGEGGDLQFTTKDQTILMLLDIQRLVAA